MSASATVRAARQTGLPPFRILVVEDDDDMRAVLLEGLSADGHSVRGCARVDDALGVLENDGPFDVLITDVRLPGASGLELLSVLQARCVRAPARIVITGFGNEDLHASAEALGAVAVFDKPFDVDDLRIAVINASV
jgi:DNA-binding NtrC family response regulator